MKVDPADIRNASDEEAVRQGCYLDESRAVRVRDFLAKFVRHSKGKWAGKPFELQPWQWQDLVRPLYGWVRADGRRRRFSRAYISTAKKSGKSMLASGLGLFHLLADGEQGALCICAATSKEQAGIVYQEAASAVDQSTHLRSHIQVIPSRKRLEHPASRSVLHAIAADGGTNEGLQASAIIIDELHRWDLPKARDLWGALLYAGSSRDQPIAIYITTAGVDRESICWDRYQYGRAVIDGTVVDPAFFALIYESSIEDDWSNPETWAKANPSMGVTLSPEAFEQDFEEARQSPAKENAFRRYRLNQWTKAESRWLSGESWEACGVEDFPDVSGLPCWGGLDLASTTDLTAFALVWPLEDGRSALRVWYWAPENAAKERERRNRPRLDTWIRDGWIAETPGAATDYDRVRSDIQGLAEEFQIIDIAFDPWNASQLAGQLMDDGISVVKFGQGYRSMTGPSKLFEAAVLDSRIVHDRNPVLVWNVESCQVEQDAAGNIKPSKARSHQKIDGVVAAVMAMGRSGLAEKSAGGASCYEEGGMII